MASLAAKCVRQRFSGYDEGEWRASSDYEKASRYALELNGGDSQSAGLFMLWLERKTDVLISKLWPEICATADGLLERGG